MLMKLFRVGTPGGWVPKRLELMEKFRTLQGVGGSWERLFQLISWKLPAIHKALIWKLIFNAESKKPEEFWEQNLKLVF